MLSLLEEIECVLLLENVFSSCSIAELLDGEGDEKERGGEREHYDRAFLRQ
jgi:hypothetical protein